LNKNSVKPRQNFTYLEWNGVIEFGSSTFFSPILFFFFYLSFSLIITSSFFIFYFLLFTLTKQKTALIWHVRGSKSGVIRQKTWLILIDSVKLFYIVGAYSFSLSLYILINHLWINPFIQGFNRNVLSM
jgi:hypothetical protein